MNFFLLETPEIKGEGDDFGFILRVRTFGQNPNPDSESKNGIFLSFGQFQKKDWESIEPTLRKNSIDSIQIGIFLI